MSDVPENVPHFLRVLRSLVRVSGPAIPIAAIVTAVSSCASNANSCGVKNGFEYMSEGEEGAGGEGGFGGASAASGQGGHGGASAASDEGGYGGR